MEPHHQANLKPTEPVITTFLKPISWLLGQWISDTHGKGKYPTIKDFDYIETLEFSYIGQPMFNYISTSSHPQKGVPMHQERGFLRVKPNSDEFDFILSHNFGMTTIETGTYNEEKKEITFKSTSISRVETAKRPHVTALTRTYTLTSSGGLEMVLCMETENTPMCEHLRATYKKV